MSVKDKIFQRRQSIHILPINSSTCPLCAFKALCWFNRYQTLKPSHSLVFSANAFSPLTLFKANTEAIHCILLQAGMCPYNYTSHSFRIGGNSWAIYAYCSINAIMSVLNILSSVIATKQPTWNTDSWLLCRHLHIYIPYHLSIMILWFYYS